MTVGYSDAGGPADRAFAADVELKHGPIAAPAVRGIMDRRQLIEQLEAEMTEDVELQERFAELDDEERVEAEAQALADRVRRVEEEEARRVSRAERVRARALQLLAEDEGGG